MEVTLEEMKNKITNHETQINNLDDRDKKTQGIVLFFAFVIPIVIGILEIIF